MPRWRAAKIGAPHGLTPSRELATCRETAAIIHVLRPFQFRAFGIFERQRTPPYPRLSHRPRNPVLSSPKRSQPVCCPPLEETGAGQIPANRTKDPCNRICLPHLVRCREIH